MKVTRKERELPRDAPVAVFDLPTIEGEISILKEGLWADEANKRFFCLGAIYLQLRHIPEADESIQECFVEYDKGPGLEVRRLVRIAKQPFDPDRKYRPKQYGPILINVSWRKLQFEIVKTAGLRPYRKQVDRILVPWVDQWACGSKAMCNFLHILCVFDNVMVEAHTKVPPKTLLYSKKGHRLAKAAIRQPSGALTHRYASFLAATVGGEHSKEWGLLWSPEWRRLEQGAREAARRTMHQQGFHCLRERTLAEGAWTFVQIEILGRTVEELTQESAATQTVLPAQVIYGDSRNFSRYLGVFYDALDPRPRDQQRIASYRSLMPQSAEKRAKTASTLR